MSDKAMNIVNRFTQLKNETERSNFENIWQNAAEYCSPPNNNVNVVQTAGERKPSNRYIDVGIRSNRIFTSGLSSHLIPAGARFFNYGTTDPLLKRNDEVLRYFTDATAITYDVLNASNFFQEFTKCLSHLGYIGTSCILAEPAPAPRYVNFRSHYINSYYIAEDAFGRVDTVYFELKMTARQVMQMFPETASPKIVECSKNPKKCDDMFTIIHAIEPRMDYRVGSLKRDDRPISSCYVEMDTKNILKEDGYYEMPYAIGRFYQATNEKYGRSPALECLSTLSMLNSMEQTRIMTAERVSNPPWLLPNDGSVRRVSNASGSISYWNAGNPSSKPEQQIVRDNVGVNDATIQVKNVEIEDAFFMPLFNPLINRVNMTATESSQRMNIALQNLVPSIGRLTHELMNPLFTRVYNILERQGLFPEMPEVLRTSKGTIGISFNSKATQAIKQLELAGTYQTLESITFLSQFPGAENILDNFNLDEIARTTAEANSVPTTLVNSKRNVDKMRQDRAAQQQEAQAMEQMKQMSDVYRNTNTPVAPNSGADMLMNEAGL